MLELFENDPLTEAILMVGEIGGTAEEEAAEVELPDLGGRTISIAMENAYLPFNYIDLATGEQRWHFYTEGPVRFAPTIDGGRVYVASDDGYLYALDLATGELAWKHRGGPSDGKLIGNEQMISHWPARSGVLVEGAAFHSDPAVMRIVPNVCTPGVTSR